MPEVNKSTFSEGLLGTQEIAAVMAGTSEMYVRFEKHIFQEPGNFSFTLPDWATAYGVIMSGGGGGGRAGDGTLSNNRNGGQGGDIVGFWGRMTNADNMVLTGVVGTGGAGGSSANAYGATGGTTSVTTNFSNVYSAAGGKGNPTTTTRGGGVTTFNPSSLFARYVNMSPGSTFRNGPAGTLNGGMGHRGGGGGGGNGGIFNNYTKGGRGGHGFVDIYVWGLPRHQGGIEQIYLGPGQEARDQFRDALSARGYNYQTIKYVPFDIQLIGSGSTQGMFEQCQSLTSVPDMDTRQVTNMNSMFVGCQSLTSVPVMDTSQVTNMSGMFEFCSSLTHVPDMDVSQVTDMSWMFSGCAALTDGNVRLIDPMDLNYVNISNMITDSGLTRMPFYDVVHITLGPNLEAREQLRAALTARGLDYQTVTEIPFEIELVGTGSATQMFNACGALTRVPDMDTSQVTSMTLMFNNCAALTHVPDMDTSQVTKMRSMFNLCESLTSVPDMDTSQVTDMSHMFYNCSSLTSVPDMDTTQVTDMKYMFYNCSSLTSVPDMDTTQVTDMSYMFNNCAALTSAPAMDTSQVTNMRSMFNLCESLTSVPDMDTSQVTDMSYMFYKCAALTDGNVRLIGRHPNVTTATMIFSSGLTRNPFYSTNGTPI